LINPRKIILLDLHYTLVPEGEYGLAVDEAVNVFINQAKASGKIDESFDVEKFKDTKVFSEIKAAHIKFLADDWDNRIFNHENAPSLLALMGNDAEKYEAARKKAIEVRNNHSENYSRNNIYNGVEDFIRSAREEGHTVYIVTDTNRTGTEPQVKALGLDGKVDGVYCCPSAPEAMVQVSRLENTKVFEFTQGSYKPDPRIVGNILLNYAKEKNLVADDLKFKDVFELHQLPNIPHGCNKYIGRKLSVKDSSHKELFTNLLANTIGFGDDYRDHLLFNNAGVVCVKAVYGEESKKNSNGNKDKRSHEILDKISGWSTERLKLLGYLKINNLAEELRVVDHECKTITELKDILSLSHAEIKNLDNQKGIK